MSSTGERSTGHPRDDVLLGAATLVVLVLAQLAHGWLALIMAVLVVGLGAAVLAGAAWDLHGVPEAEAPEVPRRHRPAA